MSGNARIITLELSKLDRVIEKPITEMTSQEHWAVFFRYLTDKSKRRKINEIVEHEEGIAMASEEAMREGRQEGRQEGRRENALEVAKVLKTLGDSAEKIARATGLSPEEIARL